MRGLLALIARHRLIAATAVVVLLGAAVGGVWAGTRGSAPEPEPLEPFFKMYQSYLLKRPGVVSVGIGERHGKRFIQVYVRELTPRIEAGIPTTLGGWNVRLKELRDPEPSPQSPRPSPSPSLPDPDSVAVGVRGIVTGLTTISDPQGLVLGWILVEGHPEPDTVCDRASVAITADTRFYRRTDIGLQPVEVAVTSEELHGAAVEIEFSGDVAGTDPVQATAALVVFVTAEQ
jgi:hypothetical protein